MSAVNFILSLARKILAKESKGITTIPNRMGAEAKAGEIAAILQNAGIPLNRADEFIKSEQDLVRILNLIESRNQTMSIGEARRSGIKNTETAKVFNIEGKELDPKKPIMGGTQEGKELSPELSDRLRGTNVERIKQRIADKKIDDDLPPPGSRGGPDDIAAPVQSAEETIKNMIEAENKKGIANIKNKMTQDIADKRIIEQMYRTANPRSLDEDKMYLAEFIAEDAGKILDDLPKAEQKVFIDRAEKALKKNVKKYQDPEDMAQGGRAGFNDGGIDILKAEDEAFQRALEAFRYYQRMGGKKSFRDYLRQAGEKGEMFRAEGGRIGYKVGSLDKARRAFLKTLGAVGAGIGALKTGLLSIGKGADAVKNLPPIKTPVTKLEGTTTEMPEWFPSFINKFRNEGKAENVFKQEKVAVSKAEYDQAAAEGKLTEGNYFIDPRTPEYIAKNPDHSLYNKLVDTDERIYTTYTNDKIPGVRVDDMDGNIDVLFENDYSQPVSINYTAPGKRGPETGRMDIFLEGEAKMEPKPKGEFVANDVETYATDPDGGFDTEDVIANSLDDMMEGTTRMMEEYATGKPVKKLSRGEGKVIEAEIRAEQAAERAAEEAAEAADDFASGGIARMLGE